MQGGQPWRPRVASLVAGVVAAALLITGLDLLAVRGRIADAAPVGHSVGSSLKLYAYQLFTTYLLPVQVMGFLLLVAMLGVVVLSRRMAEPEDPR
jgi:NADH-quinone oxidoreductase subunit J